MAAAASHTYRLLAALLVFALRWLEQRPRRQPHRVYHSLHWRLDAAPTPHRACIQTRGASDGSTQLYSFFYASCHFTTYLWLDQFFDWQAIWEDILDRPFIFAGFTAFVLLIPLAATSNNRAVRYLQHRWTLLHRLVYVIAIAGLIHYWWLIRADYLKAWIYLSLLVLLLGYRLTRYLHQSRTYRL